MSLEIKHHAVSCLEALKNAFEISVRQWHDSILRCFHTFVKLPLLLHTEALGQYSSSETVYVSAVKMQKLGLKRPQLCLLMATLSIV